MGQLTSLIAGRSVAFDFAPLIYYIEEHPDYLPLVDELFEAFDKAIARGMTSVLTLHEVLIKPLRDQRPDLAERYRQVLANSVNLEVHVINHQICEAAAQMRAKYTWLRTPDALQITTAMNHQADIIVTNDDKWKRMTEIQVAILDDLR